MAAIKVLPSNWRILLFILEIGFLLVPDSEAARGWSMNKVRAEDTNELTIACPAKFHIVITYGEYGNRAHDCSDVFNQYQLALKCNYKERCHFPKVDDGMKTSCPKGVKKYLNLHYNCMLGSNRLNFNFLTREDIQHDIICPVHTQIYIAEAIFSNFQRTCKFSAKEDISLSCWKNECNFYKIFDDILDYNCTESAEELTILYICKPQEKLITSVFEGRREMVECPPKYMIDIISSNYSDPRHDCPPNEVDTYIKHKCSSKQTCKIERSIYSKFPSGCNSDLTELLVAYRCVQVEETRNFTVFENGLVDLSCFNGQRIKIIHARYGKRESQCGSENAIKKMKEMCDGKTRCCGTANAKVFDDSTCPENDSQKLRVTYECIYDTDIFEKEEDECETIRFKISASFGDLTSETVKKMDKILVLMIGTSLPRLKQISMESYEGVIEYMKAIPSLEIIPGSSEDRLGSYSSGGDGFTDLISRTKSKYEGISWYNNFIDSAIINDAHVDIEYLADVMCETGVPVKNFETLIVANTWKIVREIDISILRFPHIEEPYFMVYRIHIVAWRTSGRLLFYEMTDGGLRGRFQSIKFRPNQEYLTSLEPSILESARKEAENLFD